MPVHRFLCTEEGISESFIRLNKDHELEEFFKPCQNQVLIDHITKNLSIKTHPYLSEANLFLNDWLANNYTMLNEGAVLLIDYGFPRHEYYHPDRNQGTLMCHYQHKAHTNFLLHPGEQDITAHVDFTHVAEAAYDAGFRIAGFTNQASFLLGNGLLSLVNEEASEASQLRQRQAIKQLTHPSEMGELFKVIALTKNLDLDLNGFQLHDKRASL
jgi:SAM-dependent MidA family methyltransferase